MYYDRSLHKEYDSVFWCRLWKEASASVEGHNLLPYDTLLTNNLFADLQGALFQKTVVDTNKDVETPNHKCHVVCLLVDRIFVFWLIMTGY